MGWSADGEIAHLPLAGVRPLVAMPIGGESPGDEYQPVMLREIAEVLDVERRQRQFVGQAAGSGPRIILRPGTASPLGRRGNLSQRAAMSSLLCSTGIRLSQRAMRSCRSVPHCRQGSLATPDRPGGRRTCSQELFQLLIGLEDPVTGKIIGRPDRLGLLRAEELIKGRLPLGPRRDMTHVVMARSHRNILSPRR